MKVRITRIAAIFVTAAILAACGSGGAAAPIISGPTISLNGSAVHNGSVYIAVGSSAVTVVATEANYSGSYTFTSGNSSVAMVPFTNSSTPAVVISTGLYYPYSGIMGSKILAVTL